MKSKYIVKVGLNIVRVKGAPEVRLEPGDELPEMSSQQIKDLLDIEAIEEVK